MKWAFDLPTCPSNSILIFALSPSVNEEGIIRDKEDDFSHH